jgi:hypothetical protein
MKNTVWVLTSEYNDYDQHGAYFEAVFAKKPTVAQLADHFKMKENKGTSVMQALAFLTHLADGGGRQEYEHCWYNLEEVELK